MTAPITVGPPLARLILAAHRSGHGVLLMGATGVGKTAILKALAERMNIAYRRIDASVLEPCDLGGIPVPRAAKMEYLRPGWMPDPLTEPEGIIVIEEATRPSPAVKNGLLNLISEKAINGHQLPPRWSIHGTANPATDVYQDAEELDAAFAARFSVVEVCASRRDWLDWAREHGIHPDVIAFVTAHQQVFGSANLRSNPRSWTWISDFLHAVATAPEAFAPTTDEVLAFIAGLVGDAMAREFLLHRTRAAQTTLQVSDLLDDYRLAHRHVVQDHLRAKRLADLMHLADQVVDHLHDVTRLRDVLHHPQRRANLASFLNDLPGEIRSSIYTRIPALQVAL